MTTYTQSMIIGSRLIGGGTRDIPRCQHRNPATASQCMRVAGHGDDRPPGTYPEKGGHVMRWGRDPE